MWLLRLIRRLLDRCPNCGSSETELNQNGPHKWRCRECDGEFD